MAPVVSWAVHVPNQVNGVVNRLRHRNYTYAVASDVTAIKHELYRHCIWPISFSEHTGVNSVERYRPSVWLHNCIMLRCHIMLSQKAQVALLAQHHVLSSGSASAAFTLREDG